MINFIFGIVSLGIFLVMADLPLLLFLLAIYYYNYSKSTRSISHAKASIFVSLLLWPFCCFFAAMATDGSSPSIFAELNELLMIFYPIIAILFLIIIIIRSSKYENNRAALNTVINTKNTTRGIKGWNWAAYGLSLIWGPFNGLWLWCLVLLAILYKFDGSISILIVFIVSLFLGFKGNELAWKFGKWKSPKEFISIQQKWRIWGILFSIIMTTYYVIAIFYIFFSR